MKKLPILLVFALLLGACAFSEKPTDPETSIETVTGSEFKVVIGANPSTGYHWEIIGDLDNGVVEFIGKEYRPDEPQVPGSGGMDVWVFKAVAPGETQITLGYFPPSNDSVQPEQTETFTVVVK